MTRLVSGLALAGTMFAFVWFLPWTVLLGVTLVVAAFAFTEYARIAAAVGAPVPYVPALAGTLAVCVLVAVPALRTRPALGVAVFGLVLLAQAVAVMTSGVHGAAFVHGAAAAMLAPLYLGLPLGALVGIHQAAGREGVLTLLATVAVSDTCQYYSGRAFGKRPLAPYISPKKTIEGAIGGFVLAPLALLGLASVWLPTLPPLAVWVAGLAVVLAGITGDLFESALKRAAGMKDSGAVIPGHGGVLDRIDALLFVTPFYYLLVSTS